MMQVVNYVKKGKNVMLWGHLSNKSSNQTTSYSMQN